MPQNNNDSNLSKKSYFGKKLLTNEEEISHMINEFESIEKMISVIYSEKNENRVIFGILLLLVTKLDLGYVESYYFNYNEDKKLIKYQEGYFDLEKIEEEELEKIYNSLNESIDIEAVPFLSNTIKTGIPVYNINKLTPSTSYTFLNRLSNFSIIPIGYGKHNYGLLILSGNREPIKFSNREQEIIDIFRYNLSMYLYNRYLEKKELKKDRLKTIGNFASSIVHEFKTPVSAIKGLASLAKNKINDPEKLVVYLENIINEADKILEMSDEIGEYAHSKEELNIEEELSLKKVLKDELYKYRDNFDKLDIRPIIMEEKEVLVKANKKRVSRALGHILKNITENVDYSKDERYFLCRFFENGEKNTIIFEDNGRGIPKDNLPMVFNPFFSTKINGTGLGLTIIKEYFEKIGFTVSIESEEEKYTRLIIEI